MAPRRFWPEDSDEHGRWGEYRSARGGGPTARRRETGFGIEEERFEMPSGGYQRPYVEGRRAYDPGERPEVGRTGQRGMPERSAEEVAQPFDEDAILERIDRDHRGRGPRGYRRADERIEEDINQQLTDDPWIDATDVSVTVRGGEVTLGGTVMERNARRRAEFIAENVSGVRHVQNNLRIRGQDAGS